MKTKSETAKTKELLRDIKSHDRALKKHPEDDALHYARAEDLVKLGKEMGDQMYYNEALISYSKAIELSPQNRTYLSDRSKLYVILERPDLAAFDILDAQKAPSTGDKVLDMYSGNTTKDILKLSNVQGEVKKLITNGKIPPELEGIFSGMIGVISGISLRVCDHDDALKNHESRLDTQAIELAEMKEKMAKLERHYSQYQEATRIIEFMSGQVQDLQNKVRQHNEAIEKHDESIKEITEQILLCCILILTIMPF